MYRTSTTEFYPFMGGNLITWKSKKPSVVAKSSDEAKSKAMAHPRCELIWLKSLYKKMHLFQKRTMNVYYDNKTGVYIVNNSVYHERTEHTEVDRHVIRKKIESKEIVTHFSFTRLVGCYL